MALKTQIGLDVPEGAVLVSSKEALKHQWEFIKNWPSEAEVLSIKFGRHIAAGLTGFSSFYIINFLKKTLYVNQTRFFLILTPSVILPSVITYMKTDSFITDNRLLMKVSCPICDQLKFAGFQLYTSILFPALYGYLSLSAYSMSSKPELIPNFKTSPREFWKFSFNIMKQATPQFQVVGLIQTILVMFLPYLQNKQLNYIMVKSERFGTENENSELQSEI